jgi:hypothetical protein
MLQTPRCLRLKHKEVSDTMPRYLRRNTMKLFKDITPKGLRHNTKRLQMQHQEA